MSALGKVGVVVADATTGADASSPTERHSAPGPSPAVTLHIGAERPPQRSLDADPPTVADPGAVEGSQLHDAHCHLCGAPALRDGRPCPSCVSRALARVPDGLTRAPGGRGCAWCGVARSVRWRGSPWQWPGPCGQRAQAHLCADCHRRWRWGRCDRGEPWRPMAAAEYLGLPYEPIPLELWVRLQRTTLRSYMEQHPDAAVGNDQRWAHLNRSGTVTRFADLEGSP